jgi:murein endopeptidase
LPTQFAKKNPAPASPSGRIPYGEFNAADVAAVPLVTVDDEDPDTPATVTVAPAGDTYFTTLSVADDMNLQNKVTDLNYSKEFMHVRLMIDSQATSCGIRSGAMNPGAPCGRNYSSWGYCKQRGQRYHSISNRKITLFDPQNNSP